MKSTDCNDLDEILLRLVMATLLGGILGIDRELHRKPAGVRVLSMVSMGSAAIAMVSVAILPGDETHPGDGVLRTVQGVLSGIGFLGAGVIMRAAGKEEIHGLTTASLIWIASILGLICGLGQWVLGLSTFGLAGCILIGGRWIELKVSQIAITPPAGSSINPDSKP